MTQGRTKRRDIRLVGELAGERRQLAWIYYQSGSKGRDLYIGLGKSPHHISRHSSGKIKITMGQQAQLRECIVPIVPLWPHIDLCSFTMPLRENFGSIVFLVDTNCWPDYALYSERKHNKELIIYPVENVEILTLAFWLADSHNRNFLGWPDRPDRADELMLEDNIFLGILANME